MATPEQLAAEQRERNRKSREGSVAGIKKIFDVQDNRVNERPVGRVETEQPTLFEQGGDGALPIAEGNMFSLTDSPESSPEPEIDLATPEPARPAETPLGNTRSGGGSAGVSGSFEAIVGPGVPGKLVAAKMAVLENRARIAQLGLQAQADSLGLVVDLNRELDSMWEADFEATKSQVQGLLNQAEQEAELISDLVNLSRGDQINPGQFFANIGGAGKFAAAIAAGVGAMATAFGGGPNAALGIIESAIDRSVRARLANQQHNRALIAHQTNFVNTLRGLASNRAEYANWLRLGYTALAQARTQQVAAGLGQTQALLAKQDVVNKLQALLIDQEIKARMASQQKVTFKFKSLAQYNAALRAAGSRAASRGGAPLASRGTRRAAAGAEQLNAAVASGDLQDIKDEFQRLSAQGVSEDQLLQLRNAAITQLQSQGEPGQALAAELGLLGRESLTSIQNQRTVNFSVTGTPVTAVANDRFQRLEEKSPQQAGEAIKRVQAAGRSYFYGIDIYNLLRAGSFGTGKGITQHLRTLGDEGYFLPVRSKEGAAILAEIDRKARWIEENFRQTDMTRNAINTVAEINRQKQRFGTGVTVAEALTDIWLKDSAIRQARFEPTLQLLNENFADVQSAEGLTIQWAK